MKWQRLHLHMQTKLISHFALRLITQGAAGGKQGLRVRGPWAQPLGDPPPNPAQPLGPLPLPGPGPPPGLGFSQGRRMPLPCPGILGAFPAQLLHGALQIITPSADMAYCCLLMFSLANHSDCLFQGKNTILLWEGLIRDVYLWTQHITVA